MMLYQNKNERKIYIDIIKIIAIFMVLFNHTDTAGFGLFAVARDSFLFPFYLCIAVLTKAAVPLFFMCTGALLLGKDEPYNIVYKKRLLRFLIVLLIGSIINYLYQGIRLNQFNMSISDFLIKIYSGQIVGSYWYLYAFLAYIMMLPLIRLLARNMRDKDYFFLFLFYLFYRVLDIIEGLIWNGQVTTNENWIVFGTLNYVFYSLMGYHLDRKNSEEFFTRNYLTKMLCSSLISILIVCISTIYFCHSNGDWNLGAKHSEIFFNTLIFMPTITIFYTMRYYFMQHKPKEYTKNIISQIAGTTFGIYLIEEILRTETYNIYVFLCPYLHSFFACCIWILLACVCGSLITWILKKLPVVNKYI